MGEEYIVQLTNEEIKHVVKDVLKKNIGILYTFEKAQEDEKYDYKAYVYGVILFISSFNSMINYNLSTIIVNLNSILTNDFNKTQIKKIVFDNKHILEKILQDLE